MKKILFILLSIALLCSIMTIAVYADSEAIAEDTAATTAGEETSETELQSVSTEPPISSGVYRFDSLYNNGMCMMVEEDGYTNGSLVLQWNTSTNSRDTLFKVEYAGYGTIPATNTTEYYYVIRSMVNCGLGLRGYSDGSVCLTTLSYNNSYQNWAEYWVYTEDSGCDVWMNASTGDYLGTPTTSANGAELEMTSSVTRSFWQMVPYTGATLEGIEFAVAPSTAYGGGYVSFFAYMYSTQIGVNGPVQYSLKETDNYTNTDKASIGTQSGSLSAYKEGTVLVRASASGVSTMATTTINIIGFSSAEYAAESFAEEYYDVAMHIHFHLTSLIYRQTSAGVTTYYHSAPAVGEPHNYATGLTPPAGATSVAVVFIEVEYPWVEDEHLADFTTDYSGLDLYISFGGTVLDHYVNGSYEDSITTNPRLWSEAEREVWADAYRETWHYHCSHCPTCDSSIYPD